uniref:fasciclin domain-containing protein n=2 Tax=Rhodohalobacter sp. 8-1 TaxID=3131972 RepID=UPI0030ED98D7
MNTFKIAIMAFAAVVLIAMAPIANQNSEQDHNHHNIVEVASDTDNLSTLVAAVQAAGLVETLSGDGPFTVFAPTNEAFDALPDGTLESLLEPANRDMLVKILTYHVVSGEVMAGDLSDGMMAETVQGSNISISIANGTVSINDATVIAADVDASNGVVHVIDSVIMPPEEESSSY